VLHVKLSKPDHMSSQAEGLVKLALTECPDEMALS